MATPIKFIRSSIGGVSVKSTATIGGVAGVPYQWNATLTVVAQAHSDPTSTPVANYYTGRNVVVGDWITSDPSGKALKVASITSQTDTQVVCVLEDVDYANALSDETGNLDGMIPNGAGIGAYIFSVKNSVPLLGNIPASLPGNLAGSDFVNNIQSRFAASATVGIDSTTGKLDASILPTPVVGGTPGAVGVTSSGPFALDASGNLTLKPGTSTMVGGVKVPSVGGAELAIDANGNISLASSGVTAGTYGNITVDAKGRVTAIATLTAANIPSLDWTKIGTGKPTTLTGYGITDAVASSAKGVANGVASLDANGLVPASQLPSYVDDVLEAAKLSSFPTTGESGKIYVALDTGKVYRWSGSTYVEIVAAPGSTDEVVEGTTNLYFTNARAQAAIAIGAPTALNTLAKLATSINNDPNVYTTLTGLTDSKIAMAVANLVGGASASANTLADLEDLLIVEVNQREAADLALQASFDAFVNGDMDGGVF